MKKLLLALCLLSMGLSASAHREFGIGVNMQYGTEIGYIGFGAKAQIGLVAGLRAEVAYDNFLTNGSHGYYDNLWDFDVNLHYVFHFGRVGIYPIVGFCYTNWKVDKDGWISQNPNSRYIPDNYAGANLGGGVQCKVAGPFYLNIDLKGQVVKHNSQFIPQLGLMLKI